MMAGIELNRPCEELADICATQEKLLINVTREKTERLLPSHGERDCHDSATTFQSYTDLDEKKVM